MTAAIELLGLCVRLGGRTVLDNLTGSFGCRALGLLGPNGAGKSTLLNTLLGFYEPFSGTASVFGLDTCQHRKTVRSMIGFMPENDAFIASMTGLHFVRYMAELSGLPPREALERAHEVFVYVGLGEARYRKLGTYSLGMKQTAKLAQAIVHGPKLLFLDEPTNGLDPAARERMIRLIQEIRDDGNTRLVISSHLLRDVEQCCDEVLILKEGRVIAQVDLEQERQTNKKFLELETMGSSEPFLQAVLALGCECMTLPSTSDGHRMKVILPANVELSALYQLGTQHDILIRRMSARFDSLEEIFLSAMRDGSASGGGPMPCVSGAVDGRL